MDAGTHQGPVAVLLLAVVALGAPAPAGATLGPAESFRVRWREDAPGTWLYHCHVESHMMQGMIGLYRVSR